MSYKLPISVIVPLGPFPQTKKFLGELLESLYKQTLVPAEVVIIDDAAHIDRPSCRLPMQFIRNPWNLGESASRNIAIAKAKHPWVFQAAYDDTMEPECLDWCARAVEREGNDKMGYYYITLRLGDCAHNETGLQGTAGGHALFNKRLWAHLGGYPKCGALGLSDIGFIDLAMVHGGGGIYHVAEKPLYNHREHEHNALKYVTGRMRGLSREASGETTATWQHPDWVEGFNVANV